ncbi:MAG: AAA family ATPase [Pseudomonadota bacterium]
MLADGRNDERYVASVAGRGYRFVADVAAYEAALDPWSPMPSPRSVRPLALARVFGRASVIDSIVSLLAQHRLVIIVGSGGIGKTTVAQAVLAAAVAEPSQVFADLAPLSDPLLLPSSIAALLGLPVHSENPLPHLIQFLEDKQLLMVLDSCEHLLQAVAGLAETLLAQAPGLRILTTSREPLRGAASGPRARRRADQRGLTRIHPVVN